MSTDGSLVWTEDDEGSFEFRIANEILEVQGNHSEIIDEIIVKPH